MQLPMMGTSLPSCCTQNAAQHGHGSDGRFAPAAHVHVRWTRISKAIVRECFT